MDFNRNMSVSASTSDTTSGSTTSANTNTNTSANTNTRRKLVKFVKNETGYRVSYFLNLLFLLSATLFGIFTLISGVNGPYSKDNEAYYDFYDYLGMFCFCGWTSLVMNVLIFFPSVTTVNRERVTKQSDKVNLLIFGLNGFSVIFIRLSDFYRPLTPFQIFASVLIHVFSYLFYMAVFNIFYAMPEDLHQLYRFTSMRPWNPVYEDEIGERENTTV